MGFEVLRLGGLEVYNALPFSKNVLKSPGGRDGALKLGLVRLDVYFMIPIEGQTSTFRHCSLDNVKVAV